MGHHPLGLADVSIHGNVAIFNSLFQLADALFAADIQPFFSNPMLLC
jgi:hypothetical protein